MKPILLIKEEERHILKILPILLRQDRKFQTEVYSVLSETFAAKKDFERTLEELRISREEWNKRFEEMRQESKEEFKIMRQESKEEFKIMRQESNKRSEEWNKHFEEMRQESNKRSEEAKEERKDLKDWVWKVVGGLQGRAGRNLEDVIAGTLRVALKRRDVKPENLKLRQKIVDNKGFVGPKGREYEIDIWVHNSESMVFEIKSYAEEEDVTRFNDKAELVIEKLKLSNPSKVFITLQKGREMTNICRELGVELV
jgi:hypothetical protein